MTIGLIAKSGGEQRDIQRTLCEDADKDCSNESTSQGTPILPATIRSWKRQGQILL